MKRYRGYSGRGKLQRFILFGVAGIVVLLLLRLGLNSLSYEIGQAKKSIGNVFMSRLCVSAMESGNSLVEFHSDGLDTEPMLMGLLRREYPITQFTINNGSLPNLEQANPEKVEGISFKNIAEGKLSLEYIITNGDAFDESSYLALVSAENRTVVEEDNSLSVGTMKGDIYHEPENSYRIGEGSYKQVMKSSIGTVFTREQLTDVDFLIRNFYIVDPDTSVIDSLFDSEAMLDKDMTLKQDNSAPQILIYHTHSQEAFIDSRTGVQEDTVVGIGSLLKKILEEDYGYNVIHDTTIYDLRDGLLDRNKAYNYAAEGVLKILDKNPSIEIIIDLHRDGLGKRSFLLDGKDTCQIMLLNGLSRNLNGPREDLENPYQQDNLAFSLQLQLKGLEKYPGLFYRNYLNGLRYNLHLRPKSILMELGTDKNSLQAAKNAMEPFAEVLDEVLSTPYSSDTE